jgi:hypothetical protein
MFFTLAFAMSAVLNRLADGSSVPKQMEAR